MICQIVVVLFILFMAFWWGSQGGFNALVHLVSVVIAGVFAFAFWELLVLGFLVDRMPRYAWGVGLLSLFALFLLIVRKIFDLTVKKNLFFSQIPNLVIGGVFGFLSGILTAGITLLGVGFLPFEEEFLGYVPLAIEDKSGQPTRRDTLWIPADDYAARFFTHLSGTAFYSYDPMSVYRPDLFVQSHLTRLKDDPHSSPVTNPASIEIAEVAAPAGAISVPSLIAQFLGQSGGKIDGRIIVVKTKLASKPVGTYDGDGLIRLYPQQIRLGVVNGVDEETRLIAPAGFSQPDPARRNTRVFVPFTSDRVQATNSGDADFAFVFVVPENYNPKYLAVRGTRFNLPAADTFKPDVIAAMGTYTPPDVPAVVVDPVKGSGTNESPLAGSAMNGTLEASAALPEAIDRNMVRGDFTYSNDSEILNGHSTVAKPFEGRIDRKVRTDRIAQPPGTTILRAQFDPLKTASVLGSFVAAAAELHAIYITDAGGTQYLPIGYAWYKGTGDTVIKLDRSDPIRSAKQIPFREVNPGIDRIYLYWQVPRGTRITGLNIGQKTHYDLDLKTGP